MTFSDRAVSLVKAYEGFSDTAYKCPAGKWTIGYGTTEGVSPGDRITVKEAERVLRQDLSECAESIEDAVAVPLTQCQFDALCSFVYNLGASKFRNSTLLRLINQGNTAEAAAEFDKWIFSNGKALKGLAARRAAEKALFLSV